MTVLNFPFEPKLKNQIKKLLEQYPEYAWYQEVIDKALAEAGDDPVKREEAIITLMLDAKKRMEIALKDLRSSFKTYQRLTKPK